MSLATLLTQPITIVRAGASTDRYNNAAADWTTATRVTVNGRLQQTDTVEVAVGRDTLIADWLLFLPTTAVISGLDRIETAAGTFEVVGVPAVVTTPAGPHHLEVRLRSIVG